MLPALHLTCFSPANLRTPAHRTTIFDARDSPAHPAVGGGGAGPGNPRYFSAGMMYDGQSNRSLSHLADDERVVEVERL